ncbi:hypothetical protein SIM22_04660 [Bacillus cereus group sp. BfR-BA-01363]|uniref:hypothetical protein n=1 Tax=Bacillus cereus group sp. BfR-BA-01363 TaxID=3094882 RepID=UPI0029C4410E|nr:hypothetical protein [Bacillus cereus group sp. BfR-BA-01363]MDX5853421.1 hypothetical protein [Bacillus cereus group sp. BfR-BA-01363]
MINVCNATESGALKLGALNFHIYKDNHEIAFSYKMINGGFVGGSIALDYEEDILPVINDEKQFQYGKIINIANNKEDGTISFFKDNVYIQIPFIVTHLSLDLMDEDEDEDGYEHFDFRKYMKTVK